MVGHSIITDNIIIVINKNSAAKNETWDALKF
jgi:hypothetical protein